MASYSPKTQRPLKKMELMAEETCSLANVLNLEVTFTSFYRRSQMERSTTLLRTSGSDFFTSNAETRSFINSSRLIRPSEV